MITLKNHAFSLKTKIGGPGLLVAALLVSSCAFNFQVTSQKTALENQILGEYWELEDDLILVSTVRSSGRGQGLTPVQLAKQNQRFNLDDIQELKEREIVGENRQGLLEVLPKGVGKVDSADRSQIDLAKILVKEENSDRRLIWNHLIATNKDLKANDLGELQRSLSIQMAKEAEVGFWNENEAGKWQRKVAQEPKP